MPYISDSFYGITNYRDPLQTELLEYSAIEYLKWCFAKVGGFVDAKLNTPAATDLLQRESSTVYNGVRSQWLYEVGLSGSYNPIPISGVYVNGTLQASGYNIDYNTGRVIFSSAQGSGSVVRVEHSYRTPSIHKIDEWFKQIQFSNESIGEPSGIYSILAKNRIQLPAVVVYCPTKVTQKELPRGIGARTYEHYQPTQFYIMTTNFSDNGKIHDILLNQKPTAFNGLNKKTILTANKNPLNYDGTRNTSGLMYPDLARSYEWKQIDVRDTKSTTLLSLPNFHLTMVSWNTEVLVN